MSNETRYVATIGFFDGVHLGHQTLLREVCRLARELDAEPCAVTFDKHPQSLFVSNPPMLINGIQDRKNLLRAYGIRQLAVYPVTDEGMSKSWEVFLQELIQQGTVGFVCGSDFRFGCRGEGDAEKLQTYCREKKLACAVVEQQMLLDIRVSSTYIRSLLETGQMEKAVRFLGHPHLLSGTVVTGRKLGHTIGIPTANLLIPEGVVVPAFGVYACKAVAEDKEYMAVTNVGTRPTVGGHRVTVEPWLLDFEGDLYGKPLALHFYAYLRPEKKFDSLEELKAEIEKNALQVREIFEKS